MKKMEFKGLFFQILFCSENRKYILIYRNPVCFVDFLKLPPPTTFSLLTILSADEKGKGHVRRERQIQAVTA